MSVPVDNVLVLIKDHLKRDEMLKDRTSLEPADVEQLVKMFLKCTYFVFQLEADPWYIDGISNVDDHMQCFHEIHREEGNWEKPRQTLTSGGGDMWMI